MDVLRKETLIILLVASVLLLADPSQRTNPEVTTTCGEKFPNILMLAWLKAYLRFVLDPGFSLVKQTEKERATRGDNADVLISKLSSRDKQEIALSWEHLHEAGAGWCQNVLFARRGTNWPINTTRSSRFPPDSQQISDRLMPPEQWDETASSVSPLVWGGQHPSVPLTVELGCVRSGKETFPTIPCGRVKTWPSVTH